MTKKVLFPSGYRSERVLSDPIRKRFRDNGNVEIIEYDLTPGSYYQGFVKTEEMIHECIPHFAMICADRSEMAGAAAACFNSGVKFAHIYAGINNNIGTTDDVNRHVMTLQSTIQFCESNMAYNTVWDLRRRIGLNDEHIHVVGITHMDDAKIEKWGIPEEPFDIVAYNPPATHLNNDDQLEIIEEEWARVQNLTKGSKRVLALFPAPDKGNVFIRDMLEVMRTRGWTVIPSLPREQYFYALQHCDRFISNSSATYYEAPVLMKDPQKIIRIGLRNANRDECVYETGASDRIVKITEAYLYAQR